jgi:hypothetical protein
MTTSRIKKRERGKRRKFSYIFFVGLGLIY